MIKVQFADGAKKLSNDKIPGQARYLIKTKMASIALRRPSNLSTSFAPFIL